MRPLLAAAVLTLTHCAAIQKIDRSALTCEDQTVLPKVSADLPAAINDLVTGNMVGLDALVVQDGLEAAYCVVQAAVAALENGGAATPLPRIAGAASAIPGPTAHVAAIARGEGWLAAHAK